MTDIPQFDLTGRVALITGASSGFGAHFARLLSAAGAKIVIAARRADRLAALQAEIEASGGSALAVSMDVTDEASVVAAYDAAEAAFGTIDTIIANAGVAADKLALNVSTDEFDMVMDTNVKGVFLTAREGARRLIASGSAEKENGRIVIIGSITADKLYAAMAPYAAAKAGVRHLGRLLAREWVRKGINVNIIQPGYFPTEMTTELFEMDAGRALINSFPRKRLCELDALNVPILFFSSDHSRGVTGSVLNVDDGQSL